jgi:hypothetical protein
MSSGWGGEDVSTSSSDDRSLVLSTVESLLAELPPALARALPACLPIIVHGMQVRAIEANHDLRIETTAYILGILERHGGQMSQGLRDGYLAAVLRLTDAGFYEVPWSPLLGGR